MHTTTEQDGIGRRLAGWIAGAALAAAMLAPGSATAAGPHFVQTEPRGTPVGERPAAIAHADFDGDGVLDAATANSRSDDVSVLLGDGRGFGATAAFEAGARPSGVAAGDVNGDGTDDLAVANSRSNDAIVLIGDGAGGFSAGPAIPVGEGPRAIAIADLDGDGRGDLITANRRSEDLTVVFGDGSGGAAQTLTLATVIENCSGDCIDPASVVAAELTGDGRLDLAVAEEIGYVTIFRNDGARAFTQSALHEAGTFPTHLTTGDLNGDGNLDLAVAESFDTLAASVLIADGAGGFELDSTNGFQDNGSPTSIAAGDVDLDGDVDLVETEDRKFLGLFLNRGQGRFSGPRMTPIGGAAAATLADFTGDGRPDLAVARREGDVAVFENLERKPRPTPVKIGLKRYDGDAFLGRVRSANPECLRGRVQLFLARPGRDRYLGGDDGADRRGRFRLRYGGELEGAFYAQINHRRVNTGSCEGARSNKLRF